MEIAHQENLLRDMAARLRVSIHIEQFCRKGDQRDNHFELMEETDVESTTDDGLPNQSIHLLRRSETVCEDGSEDPSASPGQFLVGIRSQTQCLLQDGAPAQSSAVPQDHTEGEGTVGGRPSVDQKGRAVMPFLDALRPSVRRRGGVSRSSTLGTRSKQPAAVAIVRGFFY